MKTEKFTFEHAGARLVGERAGAGEPLIFLHAGVADRRMWGPQIAVFSETRQVIAYDRRGFGETVAEDEAFSEVGDLEALLDHFGLDRVSLVGCSQGGRIAIDFALANRQRVTALALLAPAISGAPEPEPFSPKIQALSNALDDADEAGDLDAVNELEAQCWLDGPDQSGRTRQRPAARPLPRHEWHRLEKARTDSGDRTDAGLFPAVGPIGPHIGGLGRSRLPLRQTALPVRG